MSQKSKFLAQYGDSDHITKALEDNPYDERVAENATYNSSLKPEHYEKIIKYGAGSSLTRSQHVPIEHVIRMSRSDNPSERLHAVESYRLPDEHIDRMTKDEAVGVRSEAIRQTKDQGIIKSAMESGNLDLRDSASQNYNANFETKLHGIKHGVYNQHTNPFQSREFERLPDSYRERVVDSVM